METDSEQRARDIAEAAEKAARIAYEKGMSDKQIEQVAAETKANFASIKSAAEKTAEAVDVLTDVVKGIKDEQDRRDTVNKALIEDGKSRGQIKITRIQLFFVILGGTIGFITFVLAIKSAVGH
jgi:phage-related minor tail protein